MAVWTLGGGEPGRGGPQVKSLATAGCLAVLATLSAAPRNACAQDGVIYVNAPQRSAGPELVTTLRQSLQLHDFGRGQGPGHLAAGGRRPAQHRLCSARSLRPVPARSQRRRSPV